VWDELRPTRSHNPILDRIDAIEDHIEIALRDFRLDPQCIRSIVAWPWIVDTLLN